MSWWHYGMWKKITQILMRMEMDSHYSDVIFEYNWRTVKGSHSSFRGQHIAVSKNREEVIGLS